ncbi:hypothetical protein [Novosphingobium lentum]|uniref:hypothetical protein n=1 Tax=Novosphingobium lentum TaxID=145287 RepID=UPI000A4BB5CD|nr:hypothetical protein [Novosphingobium lentum]
MFLLRIACLFGRHFPNRTDVRWVGVETVAPCRACGRQLRREGKGKWRAWTRVDA